MRNAQLNNQVQSSAHASHVPVLQIGVLADRGHLLERRRPLQQLGSGVAGVVSTSTGGSSGSDETGDSRGTSSSSAALGGPGISAGHRRSRFRATRIDGDPGLSTSRTSAPLS